MFHHSPFFGVHKHPVHVIALPCDHVIFPNAQTNDETDEMRIFSPSVSAEQIPPAVVAFVLSFNT